MVNGELEIVVVNGNDGDHRGNGGGSLMSGHESWFIHLDEFSRATNGGKMPCHHMFHEDCMMNPCYVVSDFDCTTPFCLRT